MSSSKAETPENAGKELEPEFYSRMADSFQFLAQSILRLRQAEPIEYKDILKEILLRALNDDDQARTAFINQLVELVDPSHIKEVVTQISKGECGDIERKSPFREALEKHNEKWRLKIENKLTWLSPDPTGWSERRIQASRLQKALDKPFVGKKGRIYPDQELIQLVDEFTRKGKEYHSQLGFDCGFNAYLTGLKNIGKSRRNGTLNSLGNFYDGQQSLIGLLAIQNVQLENRLASILEQVVESQAKQCKADQMNTSQTAEENEELSHEVADLRKQNEELSALCASLLDDNRQKDQTIEALKHSYERLLETMGSSLSDSEGDQLSPDSSPSSATYTSVDEIDSLSDGEDPRAVRARVATHVKRKLVFDTDRPQTAVVNCQMRFQFDNVTALDCQREEAGLHQEEQHQVMNTHSVVISAN